MTARLLLVEDEHGLRVTLTDRLTSEGYSVVSAADGDIALELATRQAFHLIILDVMLPRRNGFEVCRIVRENGVRTPILMLTARSETVDKVSGLRIGADDYVIKPFEMPELLARIEALLRRSGALARGADVYEFGDVRADFRRAEVTRGGTTVELSALEMRLLRYLIEHNGEVLSRDRLLDEVWGYEALPTTRTVDVHIAWLRQKLEANAGHPRHFMTVRGVGYKFVV